MSKFDAGAPLPASIGRCADLYAEVREMRLAMQKQVDAVYEREREVRDHIINNLSKSDDTGASGLRYRAQIVTKEVPKIDNWPALTSFIRESGRFDFLQKRLSDRAIRDTWEETGGEIPGVGKFSSVDVSITKI